MGTHIRTSTRPSAFALGAFTARFRWIPVLAIQGGGLLLVAAMAVSIALRSPFRVDVVRDRRGPGAVPPLPETV